MQPLVNVRNLSKRYALSRSVVTALDGCTLAVHEGETFGLLGPNGAGKTTLLRLLLGFIEPSSGEASVAGHDCIRDCLAVRRQVAYLPGEARLFRRMNGHSVIDFFSKLRAECDARRAEAVAARLQLDLHRQVARMSTGMRQKLALAVVLAMDVRLVILDEPTANLDPTARAEVLDMVREARACGRTVIFSSHVLSEVESTCDRVAILRAGRVVHEAAVHAIRRSHRITVRLSGPLGPVPKETEHAIAALQPTSDGFQIESTGSLAPLLGWLATLPIQEILVEPTGLAAIYDRFHRESIAARPNLPAA
ncbi:MAG: ABC transporter ATP-binding protein [Planctomycetaceae bacterium]